MKTETLSIDLLKLDGGTQSRVAVNSDTVDEYAEKILEAGKIWPFDRDPIVVYHDGSNYYVSDGFHRTLAAIKAGRASVPCEVRKGTNRDARLNGMKANDKHGLRMSKPDRRNGVIWALETYPTWSQKTVAESAGVSLRTVTLIVAELKGVTKSSTGAQIAHEVPKTLGKPPQNSPESNSSAIPNSSEHDKFDQSSDEGDGEFDETPTPTPKAQPPELTQNEQAANVRKMAQAYIDKAVRAVDDLNEIKANVTVRNRLVKMLQDAGGMLW